MLRALPAAVVENMAALFASHSLPSCSEQQGPEGGWCPFIRTSPTGERHKAGISGATSRRLTGPPKNGSGCEESRLVFAFQIPASLRQGVRSECFIIRMTHPAWL